MNKELYSHFHSDEHYFVDKAWDWLERAAQNHAVKLTDFLDPRQAFILTTLVNRNPDVQCRLDGGYSAAERRRALIAPDYRNLDEEDMEMAVLSVSSGDGKFLTLEHGDYMGAILGLGMKRDKVGDIHVIEGGCHCLVTQDAADYLHLNLSQVHRVHVQTELLPLNQLELSTVKLDELTLSVASMRMDGIVSDVFRLSRAKVLIPIQAGRCRVNWKPEEDPSKPLKEGDMISMQGFGRFKVLEVEGITKKGRIRVKIGKFA
ncbi:RNA-binding protein [Paenibacillus aceris]|uniref:RNA-binding protein YlmH n=1 Tax=Paenibacillus aceris TaxID=869555 RepID=A0ABS4HTM6_9BACL|nr:YlmH/Sll1252 family protein [Paenibacillus aceris]MBP1961374.1 RNA-binding protein YlmH [Paenibacillus aceris]NHW37844.1 RNA-binding protein [Paenibacillus aceris]